MSDESQNAQDAQDAQVPDRPGRPGPSGAPAQADVTTGDPEAAPERTGATTGAEPPSDAAGDEHSAPGLPPELSAVVEAVLLVADQPVSVVLLAQVVEQPVAAVETAVRELSDVYTARGSGIDVREVAGGWRLYTRAAAAPWVERFVRDGQQARLTQAALETLAVVAYRQPVTRGRVSAVRGVNVDGVVRSLVSRGLLAEDGPDPETGGTLCVTTPLFLQKLGLTSIDQLPSLAPLLPELNEFEQDSMST